VHHAATADDDTVAGLLDALDAAQCPMVGMVAP
jgi:hypothetical protein